MSYIILMTIAGSGLFLGVLLWDLLMRKRMTEAFRYGSLVVVMLTFLVPWAWMKGVYGNVDFGTGGEAAVVMSEEVQLGEVLVQQGVDFETSPKLRLDLTVVAAWLGIGVLVLVLRCAYYFYKKRRLTACAGDCEDAQMQELACRLKEELGVRIPVRIMCAPNRISSFTMGVLKPVVFLQEDCGPSSAEIILRHEFTHIAGGHLLIKLMMDFVCCLHWFNPFVYLLNGVMERACERACDERAARSMTDDEREAYALVIVRSARESDRKKRRIAHGIYLAANGKQVEERVRVIMNKRQRKVWERVMAAGVFALLIFVDSLTALAYPRASHVQVSADGAAGDLARGSACVYLNAEPDYVDASADAAETPVISDYMVITADGEVIAVDDPSVQPQALFCIHNWQDAIFQSHLRDEETGGCTTRRYKCQFCRKCEGVILGDLLSTHTDMPCPHDYER